MHKFQMGIVICVGGCDDGNGGHSSGAECGAAFACWQSGRQLAGARANQQILFPEPLRSISAPALDGQCTIEEALSLLLAGTNLRATRTSAGVFLIKPRQDGAELSTSAPPNEAAAGKGCPA